MKRRKKSQKIAKNHEKSQKNPKITKITENHKNHRKSKKSKHCCEKISASKNTTVILKGERAINLWPLINIPKPI
jgi:hypothetical protein